MLHLTYLCDPQSSFSNYLGKQTHPAQSSSFDLGFQFSKAKGQGFRPCGNSSTTAGQGFVPLKKQAIDPCTVPAASLPASTLHSSPTRSIPLEQVLSISLTRRSNNTDLLLPCSCSSFPYSSSTKSRLRNQQSDPNCMAGELNCS
ncbi:hypothetical protein VTL71DRAFT_11865 [Oculimacula yallundae]|uniref:Uncharacterized protein n=1 Tax=Oculimacula yallundae TaxID=86028 RepID=A0ABR4CRX8_9HELO